MKVLRHIWGEVRRGENIDLYLLVGAAVVFSVLGVVGIVGTTFLLPVVSATLAVFAISSLLNRYRLDRVIDELGSVKAQLDKSADSISELVGEHVTARRFFRTRGELPAMEARLYGASTVDFVGTSLLGLSVTYQSELRRLRDEGAQIRLITSNPSNTELQHYYAMRYLEVETTDHHKGQVQIALENLRPLVGSSSSGGCLEVRITDHVQTFAYMGINTDDPNGYVQIELYLNKIALARNPIFVLRPGVDGQWFREFRDQFDFFWHNSFDPFDTPSKMV